MCNEILKVYRIYGNVTKQNRSLCKTHTKLNQKQNTKTANKSAISTYLERDASKF